QGLPKQKGRAKKKPAPRPKALPESFIQAAILDDGSTAHLDPSTGWEALALVGGLFGKGSIFYQHPDLRILAVIQRSGDPVPDIVRREPPPQAESDECWTIREASLST
ncbi:unnamed protein product, partial [Amoebophrya sp. A25]